MPFVDSRARSAAQTLPRLFFGMVLLCVMGVIAAQPVAHIASKASSPITKPPTPAAVLSNQVGPQWNDLSSTQKQILRPLAGTWNSLGLAHKNKWIALAVNYPSKAPAEQVKMQSRMVEWAALSPNDRALARLNFAETKRIAPSDRAAEWEAYQSLSTQEKERLAAKGNGKPTGAAVAVTPIPPSKLTPVPITRRTSLQDGAAATAKPRIDPNTLLPKPPLPAPSTPSPVSEPLAPASEPQPTASSPN